MIYTFAAKAVIEKAATNLHIVKLAQSPAFSTYEKAKKCVDDLNRAGKSYAVFGLDGDDADVYVNPSAYTNPSEKYPYLTLRDLPLIALNERGQALKISYPSRVKGNLMLSESAQLVVDTLRANPHTALRHISTTDRGQVCHVAHWGGDRWEGLLLVDDPQYAVYENNDPEAGRVESYRYPVLDELLEAGLIKPETKTLSSGSEPIYVLTDSAKTQTPNLAANVAEPTLSTETESSSDDASQIAEPVSVATDEDASLPVENGSVPNDASPSKAKRGKK